MAIAFVIIGVIVALIYGAVTDNGNNKTAGVILIFGVLIVGSVLEAIFGHVVGFIIIFILFAGWVFTR